MSKQILKDTKDNRFLLQRKASIIEPDTYRVAPSFTTQSSKTHFRSQSNFLSSRASPHRVDSKQNPSPFSRTRVNGDSKQTQPSTQNNLRSILRREFQYQNQSSNNNNSSNNNQTSYTNLEKSKIISSLMQDSSISNLKSQMMKIAQNQGSSLSNKPSSPSMDLLSQICRQKSPAEQNKWGLMKNKNENQGSNISFNSTRTPVPNTKDALFKSLLRKNSTILSQQNPLINSNMNSLILGQRSTSSNGKDFENKENQQPKAAATTSTAQANKPKMMNTFFMNRDNQKTQDTKIKQDQKQPLTYENSTISNNPQQKSYESQPLQPQQIQQKNQIQSQNTENNTLTKQKSQPKQKFPQYFQINLSEYIKSSKKNIDTQSTININQMLNDKSQLNMLNSLMPHNIYKQNDSSINNESKLSSIPQYQQLNNNNQSNNTNSLNIEQYEQEQADIDHINRISTVKDTENSVLHDFRLEKNYIFLN